MNTNKTLDEIHRQGLAALKKRLGVAGMVRFLQQFENGSGDYVSQRRAWADRTSLNDIQSLAAKSGRKPRRAG